MEENKEHRVIIMSMSGLLIGSLLYIFGISIEGSLWPLIVNYVMAILLYISSFLALYHNNKANPKGIYKYIMLLAVFLILLTTVVTVNQFL